MKFLLLCVFLLAFGNIKAKYVCRKQHDVNQELMDRAMNGDFDFEPNDNIKRFFFCEYYIRGIMDKNGNFKKFVALREKAEKDQSIYGKYIDSCVGEVGATREETAWNIFKCIKEEQQQNDIPIKISDICMSKTKANRRIIWRAIKSHFVEVNDVFENYMYCFFKEEGVVDKHLRLNKEMALKNSHTQDERNFHSKAFDLCSEGIEYVGPKECWKFAKCMFINS